MCLRTPVEERHLNKDAGQWPTSLVKMILTKGAGHWYASLLKMSLFHRCFFTHLANKNQLSGFYICGTLAGNGLKTVRF